MIGDLLSVIRDRLNGYLRSGAQADTTEDLVVFLDGEKTDPPEFRLGAVTLLLINVEEDNTLRAADPFLRAAGDDGAKRIQPDVRLNLYLLFVARFKRYEQALNQLSHILTYFQDRRVLDRGNTPELPEAVERLTLQLATLPLDKQNEIWNALRIGYQPSLVYRAGMLVYRHEGRPAARSPDEIRIDAGKTGG